MNETPKPARQPAASLLCPACQVNLVMSERQNIEIDYCPNCRGVWLDRGELDKIIERSLMESAAAPSRRPDPEQVQRDEPRYREDYRGGGHHGGGYRRKSWLRDLFD